MLRLEPWCIALALAAGAAGAQEAPRPEGQRVDDRRPEQPLTLELAGRPLQLTGSWEYTDERRRNFDLNNARARDRRDRDHEIKLEARIPLGVDSEAFLQAVGVHETRTQQGSARRVTRALERGQAWWRQDRLGGTPWSLQAGRIALIDRRAFWWDDDLDAVRAAWKGEALRFEAGLGRELARVSSAEPRLPAERAQVWRLFGQSDWRWTQRHRLDGFWLLQHDRSGTPAAGQRVAAEDDADASDLRGAWLGGRASGEWRWNAGPRLQYRLDLAWLRAREKLTAWDEAGGAFTAGATTARRVRGHAHDAGFTLVLPWALRPSLSVGHARGSPGFRQTGLHENKARLAGVKRIRMYGELLQPDLQNLRVVSFGAGLRLLENSSLEIVQYRYRQPRAADVLAGARLSADPTGLHPDLGRETDLVLAFREWQALELTLRWSRFSPGPAFERRDAASAFEVGVTLNF